jgi:hypothetical protein
VLSEIDIPGFMNGFMFAVWARSVRPELKLLLAGTPERMVRNSEQIGGLGRCVVGDPALSLEGPFPACSGNSAFIESGGYAGGTGHSLFLNFSDDREHIGRELIGCRLGRGRAARLRLR